jgi:hypothetical protein
MNMKAKPQSRHSITAHSPQPLIAHTDLFVMESRIVSESDIEPYSKPTPFIASEIHDSTWHVKSGRRRRGGGGGGGGRK